tara:strand:+ start:201 stop:485 length:285 start_codon:yes stop_codon:yes gene_type:complete
MDNFFKTKIILGLIVFSSSFTSITLASEIDNLCKEARDYIGCMRFHKKGKGKESFSKIKESRLIYLDKARKCISSSNTLEEIRACRLKSLENKK